MIQAVKILLVCRAELIPAAEKLVSQGGHRWAGRGWAPPCGPRDSPRAGGDFSGPWPAAWKLPSLGGQMEIASELVIYLYATMFQKGFKEA